MHARGGLQTEYMGEEWFTNVEAALEEAKHCDMRAWHMMKMAGQVDLAMEL